MGCVGGLEPDQAQGPKKHEGKDKSGYPTLSVRTQTPFKQIGEASRVVLRCEPQQPCGQQAGRAGCPTGSRGSEVLDYEENGYQAAPPQLLPCSIRLNQADQREGKQ